MTLSQAFKWMEEVREDNLEEELREFNQIMRQIERDEVELDPEFEEEQDETNWS